MSFKNQNALAQGWWVEVYDSLIAHGIFRVPEYCLAPFLRDVSAITPEYERAIQDLEEGKDPQIRQTF